MKKIVVFILISLGLAAFYLTIKGFKEKPLKTSQEAPVESPVGQLDFGTVIEEQAEIFATDELDSPLNEIEVDSYSQLVDLVHNFISEHQNSSKPKTIELLGSLKEELETYTKLLDGLDKNNPEKSTPIIEKLEAERDEILDIIDDISVIEH